MGTVRAGGAWARCLERGTKQVTPGRAPSCMQVSEEQLEAREQAVAGSTAIDAEQLAGKDALAAAVSEERGPERVGAPEEVANARGRPGPLSA